MSWRCRARRQSLPKRRCQRCVCQGVGAYQMSWNCWARRCCRRCMGGGTQTAHLWLRTQWTSHRCPLSHRLSPPPPSSAVCHASTVISESLRMPPPPPPPPPPPLIPPRCPPLPFVQFVYTSAVISESLRMHPPAHVTTRLSHEPMTVGKHKLPPGRGGGRRQGGGGGGGAAGQAQAAPR